MKRRQAIRSLLSLPAITALPAVAQQAATDKTKPAPEEKVPAELKPAPVEQIPKLATTRPDAAVSGTPHFFSASQMAALRRVSDLLVPAFNGRPGALDAGAPEFLDFLISESAAERQRLYRDGLDSLQAQAKQRFHATFQDLTGEQASEIIAPLQGFLPILKDDVLRATVNSREWAAGSSRRSSGVGQYWLPVE